MQDLDGTSAKVTNNYYNFLQKYPIGTKGNVLRHHKCIIFTLQIILEAFEAIKKFPVPDLGYRYQYTGTRHEGHASFGDFHA